MYSPFSHSDKVIARGSAVLTLLFLATLASSYATVDAAVRSNEVVEYVINPTRQAYQSFVSAVEQQIEEDSRPTPRPPRYTFTNESATSSANVRVETTVTTQTNDKSAPSQQKVIVITPAPRVTTPNTSAPSTTDWEKQAQERQAQSKADYDAAVKKMNEDYANSVQNNQTDSKAAYDEAVKKQQAEFEARKAEIGL